MHGNSEFLVLFVPFFLIAVAGLSGAFFTDLFWPIKIVLGIIGVLALAIDIFALLVQYVNWRYYKEE